MSFIQENSAKKYSLDLLSYLKKSLSLICLETFKKSLEKEIKENDQITFFVKVSQSVYRIVVGFAEKEQCLCCCQIEKTSENDSQYLNFLENNPQVNEIENRLGIIDYLGKEVSEKNRPKNEYLSS